MKARHFLVITMAVIFVAEGIIMLFFHLLRRAGVVFPDQTVGIFDSFLLTAIVFPALYLLLFHPLVLEMNRRKQAERSKDDLLAIMPHELSTPLTVIREGLSQIIDGTLGPTTPQQGLFLKIVYADVNRLNKIFDKVVSATQMLTKQVKYAFQPTDMEQFMKALEIQLRPIAEEKGVALKVSRQTQMPVCTVDGKHLAAAFREVVENAIAVTPKGGEILLSCSAVSGGMELSVQDGGPGIPADEVPAFFDRLHSIGNINERKTGGLGLGLFIAKTHIESHGGSIRLSTTVRPGTCIVMKIPALPFNRISRSTGNRP